MDVHGITRTKYSMLVTCPETGQQQAESVHGACRECHRRFCHRCGRTAETDAAQYVYEAEGPVCAVCRPLLPPETPRPKPPMWSEDR